MRLPRALPRSLTVAAGALAFATAPGCVKDISSEDRLERETQYTSVGETPDAAALEKIDCQNTAEQLNKARNVNRPEADRLMDYVALYSDLQQKTKTFEDAMTRNPDLQYQEGSQKFADAKEICIRQTADVRVELETYVRELVEMPTVQEIKGGNTVTVARLDFDTLRKAIEALNPDDKETLLARVATAEKKVVPAGASGGK